VPQKELSATIREFISRHVRSVEQLEILLMFQKDPDTSLTVPQVYDAILSTPQSVQRWLDDLTRSGLLQRSSDTDAGYRCCPDADIRSQISNLAEFYRTTPVRVIEAIYKRETSAAQSFADAFKITKDDTTP
jgi:hypothetical protein